LTEQTDIGLLRIQNLSTSIGQLRALADDIESGERSFLLTGGEHYLLPLRQAASSLDPQIDACTRYAKEEPPAVRAEVAKLASFVKRRLAQANQVLDTQKLKGFGPALDLTNSGDSETTMNSIRLSSGELQVQLGSEESDYLRRQRRLNYSAFVFFIIGSLALTGLMVWVYNALVSYLHVRDEAIDRFQRLNEDLERRVEERTRDLTQANEELQQFAYVASHDLQEPLRTITSFTQLLETRYKGRLDEDADEFIGYIVASSRRMTDLINGLLALARLRKKGQHAVPVPFDKMLDEARLSLHAAIQESGAQIHHGPLPALAVDSMQFTQVFQNLLSNAIKYRRESAPLIHVEAKREGTHWVISVSDNGRGFDPHFSERIFGLFQRLNTRDVQGTGMGLSIARKIVESHGGRMWAESAEGVGSTFFFSLPVSLEVSREEKVGEKAEPVITAQRQTSAP
jgi:signal transduction histidine kinase